MNRTSHGLAALACLALLAGCSTTPAAPVASVPTGTNRPATSTSTTSQAAPASTPSTAGDETSPFGTAYTWSDGISMTVSKPTVFKPSSSAAGVEKGKTPVVVTVTLVNKSGKAFDPVLAHLTAQSSNEEAESIYDSASKISGGPSTKVLDGREVTWKQAFSVADPKDVVVEASPGMLYDSVLFKS